MAQKQTTLREYDKLAAELISRVQSEVKPFPPGHNTEEAKSRRIERAQKDLLYFCKTYLSHHFENDWESGHREIAKLQHIWDKLMVIRGFRGLGKTTLVSTGRALQAICFKEVPFIPFLADDDDAATMNALAVKIELEYNPKIKNDFGNLVGDKWEEGDFITSSGIRCLCKSHRSFKRGARFGSFRPGIAFCDDFDTLRNTTNQDQIDKRVDFVLGELVPAMHNKPWQIWFCCNKVARKDTGTQLGDNEGAVLLDIPAEREKTGRPTHPKSFPRAKLDTIRKTIGTVRYNREYRLKITSGQEDDFQEDWFVTIAQPEPWYKWVVGFVDPAARKTKTSDLKAIVILGYTGKHVDVLWSYGRRSTINHMVRACFAAYKKYDYHRLGVESNGFQILLKDRFDALALEYKYQLPLQMIDTSSNKNADIMSLQPGIENGYFRFVEGSGDNDRLVDHFLEFDSSRTDNLDDMPDAMAKAWKMIKRLAGITAEVEVSTIEA